MSKFVKVEGCSDFEKIKEYIKNNRKYDYYIAPKLMYELLNSFNLHCVIGINLDYIKITEQFKIDLLTIPVYNKVFENDVFRISAINIYNSSLFEIASSLEREDVIFGIEEDEVLFSKCSEYETIV